MLDMVRVNAAVKIYVTLTRTLSMRKAEQLRADLKRLKDGMTSEDLTEYNKRIA